MLVHTSTLTEQILPTVLSVNAWTTREPNGSQRSPSCYAAAGRGQGEDVRREDVQLILAVVAECENMNKKKLGRRWHISVFDARPKDEKLTAVEKSNAIQSDIARKEDTNYSAKRRLQRILVSSAVCTAYDMYAQHPPQFQILTFFFFRLCALRITARF